MPNLTQENGPIGQGIEVVVQAMRLKRISNPSNIHPSQAATPDFHCCRVRH